MIETFQILDIGAAGDGIARMPDGRTVFVPLTVTGDVVTAEIDREGRGKILTVVKPSPHRAVPPCRHFGICGGCSLQHIDAQTYQAFKKEHVIHALQSQGLALPEIIETIFIPDRTRRRANFAARIVKGKALIGFHERKSANIRDVPDCLLITQDVRAAMEAIRPHLPYIAGDGNRMDVLIQCVDGQTEIALTGKIAPGWEAQQALADALRAAKAARICLRARDYEAYEILLEEKALYKRFDSLLVNLAPGAFLQPSAEGELALTQCVIDGAGDASRVADLFCGNGTFTGPLMTGGRDVMAADFAPDAIAVLKKAGGNAHLRNLFKEPMMAAELADRDCVVLDPPRAGAQAQVRVIAEDTNVPKIVYVSCNPQSFAKDAKILCENGYSIARLTIVDQFIWSPHTELAAVFTKRD
jgi:23S rRNA (uracil1939-C5)-methyltransferase